MSCQQSEYSSLLTRADAVTPLPENVLSLSVSRRAWSGACVDVTEWRCSGMVAHQFPYETETRLIALLEEVGSPCEPRLRENQPCPIGYVPRHMDFAPAGMEMWGYSADIRFVKDATLTFDFAALGERLATRFDRDAISTPRLRFSDERIWTLIKLLSDAVNDPDPSVQLYGDGLTAAITAQLFAGYGQLEQWIRASGAHWLRLGMVEGNGRAEAFWRKVGYDEVRKREGMVSGQRVNTVRVMVKPLATGSLVDYLDLVARDRPEAP